MNLVNNSYIFRVNADSQIGFGHLVRCSALANIAYEKGYRIVFATNYPEEVKESVKCFEYKILDLSSFSPFSQEEVNFLVNSLRGFWSPMVFIIDSYDITKEYLIALKSRFPETVLAVMDDLADRAYPVDVLINGNAYAEQLDYSRQGELGTKLLLGTKYLLLRREFQKCSSHPIKDKVEGILVIFGGSDIANMTEKVLNILMNMGLGSIKVHVVLGHGVKKGVQGKLIKSKNIYLYRNLDAEQLRKLMEDNDIAISAGGSTLYELASCGVPTIAVKVAANQVLLVDELERRGIVIGLDSRLRDFDKELTRSVMLLLSNKSKRKVMASKASGLIDGEGALRILNVLETIHR